MHAWNDLDTPTLACVEKITFLLMQPDSLLPDCLLALRHKKRQWKNDLHRGYSLTPSMIEAFGSFFADFPWNRRNLTGSEDIRHLLA